MPSTLLDKTARISFASVMTMHAIDIGTSHDWFANKFLRINADKATGRVLSLTWHKRPKSVDGDVKGERGEIDCAEECSHVAAFNPRDLVGAFYLFGLGPDSLTVGGAGLDEAYALIESIPIPDDVVILQKVYCECDVGRCNEARDYKVIGHGRSPITYGDVFAEYGDKRETHDLARDYYHEHPDSIYFFGDWIKGDPRICPNREPKTKPVGFVFDPSRTYAAFGYSR
nr:hypothetical protein [Pandoravirus massiliensis]